MRFEILDLDQIPSQAIRPGVRRHPLGRRDGGEVNYIVSVGSEDSVGTTGVRAISEVLLDELAEGNDDTDSLEP